VGNGHTQDITGIAIFDSPETHSSSLQQVPTITHNTSTIQLETNCQLWQKNRKKNTESVKSGSCPGGCSAITDEGTWVLTIAEAQERKQKAEEKKVAELQKQEQLEKKRQDKALHEAMLSSPIGPLYEALPAAEEGESHVFLDLMAGCWVECLKPDFVLSSSSLSGCHEEDFRATPLPRLLKDRKKWGLIAPSKAQGTWEWIPVEDEMDWAFVHITFP